MNKKAGVGEVFVTVAAYVLWALIILIFILLFNLRAYSSGQSKLADKTQVLVGELNYSIQKTDEVLNYFASSVKECSKNTEKLDLTYAELINLAMKGNPEKGMFGLKFEIPEYEKYLEMWSECTQEYFYNAGYKVREGIFISYSLEKENKVFFLKGRADDYDISITIPTEKGDVLMKIGFSAVDTGDTGI